MCNFNIDFFHVYVNVYEVFTLYSCFFHYLYNVCAGSNHKVKRSHKKLATAGPSISSTCMFSILLLC